MNDKKRRALTYAIVGVIIVIFAFVFYRPHQKTNYIHNEGKTQGTYYSATYLQPQGKDLQPELQKIFYKMDMSLSTYNPNSIISKINQNNDSVTTDAYFDRMYKAAKAASIMTDGYFDITVAPLVNAWGFGFGNHQRTKIPNVKMILPYVGYNKIHLVNHKIIKDNPKTMLDASAIAQGLTADLVAEMFDKEGCKNYMIDVGGELVCKGLNPDGEKWHIGVDQPKDEAGASQEAIQTVLSLTNVGLTTSGNYRQFYYLNGKKYAHEINPHTGYPVVHNLLSATVVAPNCTLADAYATAFMVMGMDSAIAICHRIPGMDCYLIYSDKDGKYQVKYTDGFKKYLPK